MEMTKSDSALKSLLRGEIAAVETYRQAKEKYRNEAGFSDIHQIEEEHEEAMRELRALVPTGAEDEDDSGAWGAFAKAVTGAAKLVGYKATLKALKEGEEHGVKEYEEAMAVADSSARPVLSKYLSRQRQHISTLDSRLM